MTSAEVTSAAERAETPLTIVLVAADRFETIRRTLDAVAAQTIADRLEVLLVAPDATALAGLQPQDVALFARFEAIEVGPISDVDKAAAPALRKASSPVVALIEDHAYPEPDWAEAMLRAHRGVWAAVGSTVVNANPDSDLSWINQLLAYGEWTEPMRAGEGPISRHNVAIKRSWLEACDGRLEDMLGRGGTLFGDIKRRGGRFWVERDARIRHVNPSRLASTLSLRLHGARVTAAALASSEGWPWWRRAANAALAPAAALIRIRRLTPKVFTPELRSRGPRLFLLLIGALLLNGIGKSFGYLFGAGEAESRMAAFEFRRDRHLTENDRRKLAFGAG